jgi:hypothetical protein
LDELQKKKEEWENYLQKVKEIKKRRAKEDEETKLTEEKNIDLELEGLIKPTEYTKQDHKEFVIKNK